AARGRLTNENAKRRFHESATILAGGHRRCKAADSRRFGLGNRPETSLIPTAPQLTLGRACKLPPPPAFGRSPSPASQGRIGAAALSSPAQRGRGTARERGGGGKPVRPNDRWYKPLAKRIFPLRRNGSRE